MLNYQRVHMKMTEQKKSVWIVWWVLVLLVRASRFWIILVSFPISLLTFFFTVLVKLCCSLVSPATLATVGRLPPHFAMRCTSCRSLREKERFDRFKKKIRASQCAGELAEGRLFSGLECLHSSDVMDIAGLKGLECSDPAGAFGFG